MSNLEVIVVGAGLAGLAAGRVLRNADVRFTLFEGSDRIGGRVQSELNLFGDGLVTELGAEFIDSTHTAVLDLCREFALPLIDTQLASESGLEASYFFDQHHRDEKEVIAAFAPLAEKMQNDLKRLSPRDEYTDPKVLAELDCLSISEYLTRIGANGWIRTLLEVAYTTENGIESAEQSCLNLLEMIDLDRKNGFNVFGSSNQRYKIQGGNERLTRAMAATFPDEIKLQHRLISLQKNHSKYELTFAVNGGTCMFTADIVVLATPFAALRLVALPPDWPALTLQAIHELAYGTNEKLIVGTQSPVWRIAGFSGDAYSDLPFQTGWDSGRMQETKLSSYTFFLGGTIGAALGESYEQTAVEYINAADALYPGMRQSFNGRSVRTHWTSNPLFGGSYSTFAVGQTAQFRERGFAPVDQVYFAGEHCSTEFQGFMNGAVETGVRAAEMIVRHRFPK